MISVMGANEDQRESETRTLGEVLYVNRTEVRVSEQDWVRLVQSIAAGDELALHSLYEQTYRIVFTLIVRIINFQRLRGITHNRPPNLRSRAASCEMLWKFSRRKSAGLLKPHFSPS